MSRSLNSTQRFSAENARNAASHTLRKAGPLPAKVAFLSRLKYGPRQMLVSDVSPNVRGRTRLIVPEGTIAEPIAMSNGITPGRLR